VAPASGSSEPLVGFIQFSFKEQQMYVSDLQEISHRFRTLIENDFDIQLQCDIGEGTAFPIDNDLEYVVVRLYDEVEEELLAEPQLPGHPPLLTPPPQVRRVATDRYRIDFCWINGDAIDCGV